MADSSGIIFTFPKEKCTCSGDMENILGTELVETLQTIKKNRIPPDISLLIGKIKITAHRAVLKLISGYFKALVKPHMLEGTKEEIPMLDLDGTIVAELINFGYTGKINYSTSTAAEMLQTASYLDVTYIRNDCSRYIAREIDAQNFVEIYQFGKKLGEVVLVNLAMDYFLHNFASITQSEYYPAFPVDILESALASEDLHSCETLKVPIPANLEQSILNAVLSYVAHDAKDRSKFLYSLLTYIRLPLLFSSSKKHLKKHNLMKLCSKSKALVQKAELTIAVLSPSDDAETCQRPRQSQISTTVWSPKYAGGGHVTNIIESFDDSTVIPQVAHITAMKMWIRDWYTHDVWGGYEITFSNGKTLMHGGNHFGRSGREYSEFRLDEDEVITSLTINSGWMIDKLTFRTSKGRTLGPYGGPGGSQSINSHESREENGGFLVCTKGDVVHEAGFTGIINMQFMWAFCTCCNRH